MLFPASAILFPVAESNGKCISSTETDNDLGNIPSGTRWTMRTNSARATGQSL
jgi:hypothetical protein